MQTSDRPNVFIRSMATRGNLGGLSRATIDAVAILDAAGFEKIIVETVGVGQDEVEIVKAADVSVVVLVPGMGDDVQALKAGIMEISDVFVINKADREGVFARRKNSKRCSRSRCALTCAAANREDRGDREQRHGNWPTRLRAYANINKRRGEPRATHLDCALGAYSNCCARNS